MSTPFFTFTPPPHIASPADARFPLGELAVTRGAFDEVTENEHADAVLRHVRGEWAPGLETATNEAALRAGHPITTIHTSAWSGASFYVITDGARTRTTILLAGES